MNTKFLRFVVTQHNEVSRQPCGLFSVAYTLLRSQDMSLEEAAPLREALAWFEEKLPAPDHHYITDRFVFWYRVEAVECIQKMWWLAGLLNAQGYLVELQKCEWPGSVIYNDEYQVAAIPKKR